MSTSRLAALVLIVIGILMLGYPMLSYTTREKVVDIGPVEITKSEEHSLPVAPILGGVAIVVGLGLLISGRRPAG